MTRVGLHEKTRRRAVGSRAEALEAMNPALRKMAERIETKMDAAHEESLRYYYQLGQMYNEVKDNSEKYGKGAIKLLEVALVAKGRLLRSCALFARRYGVRELDNIIRLYNETSNFQLQFAHIVFLVSIEDASTRMDLANEAVVKEWDPATLHDKIKKRFKRSGGHGRGHKVPATVPAQVRQMKNTSAGWLGKQDSVWKTEVFKNLREYSPSEFDEEILSDLKEVRAQMVQMARETQANIARIDRAIEHAQDCMKKAKEQAKKEAKRDADERPVGHRHSRQIDLTSHNGHNGAPKRKKRRSLQTA